MKITETIERNCCEQKDLKPYLGNKALKLLYCVHCGQLWEWNRRMDAAGSMEDCLERVELKRITNS
jgi:hypothetical protein